MRNPAILVTRVGVAEGTIAAAAALACARSDAGRAALLIDLSDGRAPRPALVASTAARDLEQRLAAHLPEAAVAARGHTCHLAMRGDTAERLPAALTLARETTAVVHVPPDRLRPLLETGGVDPDAVLMRADLGRDRALAALAARDLIAAGLRVAILKRALPWVQARRALFGLLPAEAQGGLPPRLVRSLAGEYLTPGAVGT